jgi:S-adenosylmethionine:tRNA ribosyltransferase-isomerase
LGQDRHLQLPRAVSSFLDTGTMNDLLLSSYSYQLPPHCIAQNPAEKRDHSRLLLLDRRDNSIRHQRFADLVDLIEPGDMLIVNDTKVFPARLLGRKETGGKVEAFLLHYPLVVDEKKGVARAEALIKASKRPKPGSTLFFGPSLQAEVAEDLDDGKVSLLLRFDAERGLTAVLEEWGQVPLPPYIERPQGTTPGDAHRYQTIYADQPGAVAAPTAGLHFTESLLAGIVDKGATIGRITLHVGYGTFAPVREEDITRHQLHHEYCEVSEETAQAVAASKARGGRIWAVGTTTVRTLEFAARADGRVRAFSGWCDLYIYPGFAFRVVDHLVTNFHLPDSSLLFLVAAFCGRETLLSCYRTAIEEGYRFFSYGDAMAIVGCRGK